MSANNIYSFFRFNVTHTVRGSILKTKLLSRFHSAVVIEEVMHFLCCDLQVATVSNKERIRSLGSLWRIFLAARPAANDRDGLSSID